MSAPQDPRTSAARGPAGAVRGTPAARQRGREGADGGRRAGGDAHRGGASRTGGDSAHGSARERIRLMFVHAVTLLDSGNVGASGAAAARAGASGVDRPVAHVELAVRTDGSGRGVSRGREAAKLVEHIHEAMRTGVHLNCIHEFPAVVGPPRHECEFGLMFNDDWTPAHLTGGPTNLYKEIALALKGVEWRQPGLVAVASKLAGSASEHRPIDVVVPSSYEPKTGPNPWTALLKAAPALPLRCPCAAPPADGPSAGHARVLCVICIFYGAIHILRKRTFGHLLDTCVQFWTLIDPF